MDNHLNHEYLTLGYNRYRIHITDNKYSINTMDNKNRVQTIDYNCQIQVIRPLMSMGKIGQGLLAVVIIGCFASAVFGLGPQQQTCA